MLIHLGVDIAISIGILASVIISVKYKILKIVNWQIIFLYARNFLNVLMNFDLIISREGGYAVTEVL